MAQKYGFDHIWLMLLKFREGHSITVSGWREVCKGCFELRSTSKDKLDRAAQLYPYFSQFCVLRMISICQTVRSFHILLELIKFLCNTVTYYLSFMLIALDFCSLNICPCKVNQTNKSHKCLLTFRQHQQLERTSVHQVDLLVSSDNFESAFICR